MASIAFPAWCLGRDPSAQILCVSYAQDLADKLARDCRSIMMSPWYRLFFVPHGMQAQPSLFALRAIKEARSNDPKSASWGLHVRAESAEQ